MQRQQKTERHQHGAELTNQPFKDAREFARQEARELVASDTAQRLRKGQVVAHVSEKLIGERLRCTSDRKLWQWLTDEPSMIPEYMTRGGRPQKQET